MAGAVAADGFDDEGVEAGYPALIDKGLGLLGEGFGEAGVENGVHGAGVRGEWAGGRAGYGLDHSMGVGGGFWWDGRGRMGLDM